MAGFIVHTTFTARFQKTISSHYNWLSLNLTINRAWCDSAPPLWGIRSPLAAQSKVGYRKRFAQIWASVRDPGPMVPAGFGHWTHLMGSSPRPSWTPLSMGTPRRATSFFLSSSWFMRDHVGRSTRNSSPVMTSSAGGAKGFSDHRFHATQPTLPNCLLCNNTETTTSIGWLIKSSRL